MRSIIQKIKDFITFPLRALMIIENDKYGLSSLRSERFDYASKYVIGYCLDVGCGKNNLFVKKYLNNNGKGIDVYLYGGLTAENIVEDITRFPYDDCLFFSVTFIGNINHIPRYLRDVELKEAYRCLKRGGNIIVTMGNPLVEIIIHKIVYLYDKYLGTSYDMDSQRGMHEEEAYYLTDNEIIERLDRAGFKRILKIYFKTQWCLNHLFVAWKD